MHLVTVKYRPRNRKGIFFAFVYYFIESFINLKAMFIILKCLLYRTNLKFFVEFQPYLCVIFIDIAPRKTSIQYHFHVDVILNYGIWAAAIRQIAAGPFRGE